MTSETPVTSMEQVARLAGISRAVVSDVINDRWRKKGISQQTHDRIRSLIEKHNFRPNALARSLAAGKTFTVGVQLPSSFYEHWTAVQGFLDGAFRKRGYHMSMATPTVFHGKEEEEIRHLCERQVDGLILSPTHGSRMLPLFKWVKDRNIPFVFIGDNPVAGHYGVVDDNKGQARMAIEHLIRLGHKRIAYIHSSSGSSGERERRRGYLETLRDYDLPILKDYLKFGHYTYEVSAAVIRKMLALPEPPTAVYCAADAMALGVLGECRKLNVRVPEDLAVVGHADDIPFITEHRVPLTTIRQPRQHLAEFAAWMLLDLIEGRTPVQSNIRLPGELVVRESCGARLR